MSGMSLRRRIERWLACLLMCGLVVNLHLIPGRGTARADDPVVPACDLPVPIPPEMQELIDLQEAVYAVLFGGSFDVCEDALLLDEPLDGSVLPTFVTGQNAGAEEFGFEVLDWFGADFSELPPEDQALLEEWGAIAGLAVGELSTQLGAIRVVAMAVSVEPPDQSAPRMNSLLPIDTFPANAWDALYEYWYDDVIYRDPCGGPLDEDALSCLLDCLDDYRDDVNDCRTQADLDVLLCSAVCGGALEACVIGGITLNPAGILACLVGGVSCISCVKSAARGYRSCLNNARAARNTCENACCISLAFRQAQSEPHDP